MVTKGKRVREGRCDGNLRTIFIIIPVILLLLIIRVIIAESFGSRNDQRGLDMASKIIPENAQYYYLLGLLRYDRKDIDGSVMFFIKSLKLNPSDSRSWLGLARSFIEKGNNDRASYAIKQAIRMDGNSPDTIWEAGLLSLMNGNNEDASGLLRRYLSM
ncbi:MAG: tetratricopeptide repeat protein, partial [Thermodesulfovibrionales bacterium]